MGTNSLNPFSRTLLEGKTALVTGAGKGIGRACSAGLTACGATVIAVSRTESDLDTLKEECGENLIPHVGDATSNEFLYFLDQHPVGILVNNLGTNKPQKFVDVNHETFELMLDLNVRTVFNITQRVVRNLIASENQGSIINISSQMGHVGSPERTVYCMTKHAIEGFTKALAVELGEKNIRVNTVCPTFIETPMTKPMFDNPDFKKFVLDKIPLGRVGNTEDVANAVVYLASEASALITGSSLMVDGGWTAQ